ncbi:MAG: hypothetical protein CL543_09670 [Alcanivorax sp.]|nr:hypothetical protein [Alcanivorax sp.]MBI53787.1 hypothetical protein [Alcanivorax sp.]MBU59137.1 hypothetical protein [Alcanivorax sp.]HCE39942.1 hypothetical protein [Alcanivorax sp.]|tara:strand:+ start:51480 stop:52691 length:1212 start_codon:yes stop_codon:yes gene_type:complete
MTSWKHSARALAWVAILACGFIQPRYAGAIDLNLGLSYGFDARVEAGLDAPTRRLIERLPEKVRIETLKLLREALPLVDQSVYSYLDRTERIIDTSLVSAGCTAQGAMKALVDDIDGRLPFSKDIYPVEDIVERVERMPESLNPLMGPRELRIKWADLAYSVGVTHCQVRSSPTSAAIVEEKLTSVERTARLWARAQDSDCDTARECLLTTKRQVETLVANSEGRDVKAAGAEAKLKQIRIPPEPDKRWLRSDLHMDYPPYEHALAGLFRISDAITVVRETREAEANALLLEAKRELTTQRTRIAQLKSTFDENRSRTYRWEVLEDVANEFGQVAGRLTAIKDTLGRVADISLKHAEALGDLEAERRDLHARAQREGEAARRTAANNRIAEMRARVPRPSSAF